MAFKFPFTNYHELNLTWVLDQLKSLFEQSEENVTTIKTYENRLTAVETELPGISETASEASRAAAASGTLAQTATQKADTAQENAVQAQGLAGTARQEAEAAQTAANEATQAAQQAQATAQNFDGRITQAENDASQALEASRSFENRVQAAITTANNAAQTATNAQGIATRADQNAALALDTLNAQRSELERIGAEQSALITEETESGKAEIEALIDTIPPDYTALADLVDKKAPVIINTASGSIAFFDDGADDMKIQKLVVNIEPVQAGSGDPSSTNIRPIYGLTGADIKRVGKNLFNKTDYQNLFSEYDYQDSNYCCKRIKLTPNEEYTISITPPSAASTPIILLNNIEHVNGDNFFDCRRGVKTVKTYTTDSSGNLYIGVFFGSNDAAYNARLDQINLQIERGNADTVYTTYTVNQISVNWEDVADKVYGGTLTLNQDGTGMLSVDVAKIVLNGTQSIALANWRPFNNSSAWLYAPGITPNRVNTTGKIGAICDSLAEIAYGVNEEPPGEPYIYDGGIGFSSVGSSLYGLCVRVPVAGLTNSTLINAYLAENPITIIYPIINPSTYSITAEQISGILKTIYGINNILANAGPVSVDYPADTKLYIDGKLAELQATILENI